VYTLPQQQEEHHDSKAKHRPFALDLLHDLFR
jgi:hypothetical protein